MDWRRIPFMRTGTFLSIVAGVCYCLLCLLNFIITYNEWNRLLGTVHIYIYFERLCVCMLCIPFHRITFLIIVYGALFLRKTLSRSVDFFFLCFSCLSLILATYNLSSNAYLYTIAKMLQLQQLQQHQQRKRAKRIMIDSNQSIKSGKISKK